MNPHHPAPKRLLIGSGKLANHLCHWWNLKKIPFSTWSRKADPDASQLNNALKNADVVFLAISDSALLSFSADIFARLGSLHTKKIVHFSGSLTFENLLGVHPLMTFGPELYSEDFYDSITLTSDSEIADGTIDVFPKLPNKIIEISKESKPLYHALLVLLGNLPSLMLREFNPMLRQLGIEPQDLKIYLQKVLDNSVDNPATAPTGPWVRGDLVSIQKHIVALQSTEFLNFYLESLKTFAPSSSAKIHHFMEPTHVQL